MSCILCHSTHSVGVGNAVSSSNGELGGFRFGSASMLKESGPSINPKDTFLRWGEGLVHQHQAMRGFSQHRQGEEKL